MDRLWVYENWTHKRVRVHQAECGSCNDGHGTQASHSGRNDKWHGPYTERAAAYNVAARLGRENTKWCAFCAP